MLGNEGRPRDVTQGKRISGYDGSVSDAAEQSDPRTERLTISLPAQLSRALRAAADEEHVSISRWVADSVQDRLLLRQMAEYIREYEAEYGEISDEEIARTRAEVEERSRPWR